MFFQSGTRVFVTDEQDPYYGMEGFTWGSTHRHTAVAFEDLEGPGSGLKVVDFPSASLSSVLSGGGVAYDDPQGDF